jgi:hypothetical protein
VSAGRDCEEAIEGPTDRQHLRHRELWRSQGRRVAVLLEVLDETTKADDETPTTIHKTEAARPSSLSHILDMTDLMPEMILQKVLSGAFVDTRDTRHIT